MSGHVVKHSILEKGLHIGSYVSLNTLDEERCIEKCSLRQNIASGSDIDVFQNCL